MSFSFFFFVSVAYSEDTDTATSSQRPYSAQKAPACFCFGKRQSLTWTTNRSSANRSPINIHACKSIQMVALTIGSMCKRWSDSSSGQEASRASLRPSPWLPGELYLQHRSQWRESLQYLQLATYYHSWVCFCTAPRLHPSYTSPLLLLIERRHSITTSSSAALHSPIPASHVLRPAESFKIEPFFFNTALA